MSDRFFRFMTSPGRLFFQPGTLGRSYVFLLVAALLFNYFLEPFAVNRREHLMPYFWICVIHSFFPISLFFAYFLLIGRFRARALAQGWPPWKDLAHMAVALLVIGLFNFLIRDLIYDNPCNWSWGYLLEETRNAFLAGSWLIGMAVLGIRTRTAQPPVQEITEKGLPDPGDTMPEVFVEAQLKSDSFSLPLARFLFAKAEGNYVCVVMLTGDGRTESLLKRLPLKQLEDSLHGWPWAIKTHRAYLVNARHIRKVKGNALGGQLVLEGCTEKIPVSRGNFESFCAKWESLKEAAVG